MSELNGTLVLKNGGCALFVFRPGEPALINNVFASWPELVAAAALVKGEKVVFFDNTLAATNIPAGAWDFLTPTEFAGDPGVALGPNAVGTTATAVGIADGTTLANVDPSRQRWSSRPSGGRERRVAARTWRAIARAKARQDGSQP